MADPKLKPTGMEQGTLIQALYEIITIMISGTVCAEGEFSIMVFDKARLNSEGPASVTFPKLLTPSGVDQGYLCDCLYEIGYGVITTLSHAAATYFTTGVYNQAGCTIGTLDEGRVIRPNGVNMGHVAQFLYEAVNTLIDQEAGVAASDFTVDIQNLAGNITGIND